MRTITIEKTLYTIQELKAQNQKAFDKALSKWAELQCSDSYWYESTIDDFSDYALYLGFDIADNCVSFSGFYSQGDGASFKGQFSISGYGLTLESGGYSQCAHIVETHKAIKAEKHRFYRALCKAIPIEYMRDIRAIFVRKIGRAYVNIDKSGRYSHEYTMSHDSGADILSDIEYALGDNAEFCNMAAIESECESFAESIIEMARGMARTLYRDLENEYEYLTGEECFIESCDANGYEFDASGKMQ